MSTEKMVAMVVIGFLFFLFALVNAKNKKDILLGACMALGLMAFIAFMHSPAWEYIEVTVFNLPPE